MLQDLERLIELQRLDTAIADGKRLVAAGPERRQAADARLSAAQRVLEDAKHRHKEGQDAKRVLEKDAALYQGRLSKYKDQLSSVKTNREYTAMQHEIATAETELRAVEDKELEIMMAADGLAAEIKAAEVALAARQKEIDAERKAIDAEIAEAEAALSGLLTAREAIVKQIEPRVLSTFQAVALKRKGVGLSYTSDGLCALCHVRLRPQVYQEIRLNASIIQCDTCNRIVYYVPPPTPEEVAAAEAAAAATAAAAPATPAAPQA